MPGVVRRKRHAIDLSDGDDDDSEQSDATSSVSVGSKRVRRNRDASEELGEPSFIPTRLHNGHSTAQNGHDSQEAFQPGSIVRVKMQDFVTYTEAEFHPGPSLNMVIGPNGTGKSTLVCAICLGLGWETKNLGRAKEIGAFVKHGSREAFIEIELAAANPSRPNPVLRRKIIKEGNKSEWWINGRKSTQKELVRLAKSFAIQVDNLCQFLPQDRVADFARLDAVALLKETLRAAAPEHMNTQYEELKSLRVADKEFEQQHASEEQNLAKLQKKQDDTRSDVELWEKRQALASKSKTLESCRPLIQCNILKRRMKELRLARNQARAELGQLQADVEPTRRALDNMQTYCTDIKQARDTRQGFLERATKMADTINKKLKDTQANLSTLTAEFDSERNGEKTRKMDRRRAEHAIADIDRQMQNRPVEWDEEEFKTERIKLRGQLRAIDVRETEILAEKQTLQRQAKDKQAQLRSNRDDQSNLNSQQGQRESQLRKISSDTANAWKWIEDNRGNLNLKGEVHGPPILTCTVPEPALATIVESQFRGQNIVKTITCTNSDDARLLSDKLFSRNGLNLHDIAITTVPKPLAFYRSPLTADELRHCGLEGWVKDQIQGPDAVRAMLCEQAKLHQAAFTRGQLSSDQHQSITATSITTWVADGQTYRISRRREYGQESTSVSPLPATARFFGGTTVNVERQQQLNAEKKDLERTIMEVKHLHENLKTEESELKDKRVEVQDQLKLAEDNRNAMKKAWDEFETLPVKRAAKEQELTDIKERMRQTGDRLRENKKKSEAKALEVANLAVEFARAGSRLRQLQEDLLLADIRLIEATSDFETLTQNNSDMLEIIKEKEAQVQDLDAQKTATGDEFNKLARRLNRMTSELSPQEEEIMQQYSACETLEDLEDEIESVMNQLGLLGEGNVNTVNQYHERTQQIEKVEDKLANITVNLEEVKAQIKEIRDAWEPELDALIGQVSEGFAHNFSKIGCAGQVGVYKADSDFERWSVQIEVKFREHESMSILDSHRQSGGERAVSTIFYLMALQDFARAPFRVVDEINQGMDPRNERMVHERMVDIACRERTSQYFLVTPKLLNDLKYHPKMRVHCINSGAGVPADKDLDWRRLAAKALEIRGRA